MRREGRLNCGWLARGQGGVVVGVHTGTSDGAGACVEDEVGHCRLLKRASGEEARREDGGGRGGGKGAVVEEGSDDGGDACAGLLWLDVAVALVVVVVIVVVVVLEDRVGVVEEAVDGHG